MTTVSELKAMLREEIAGPLDYPRVPGLSAEDLEQYNNGYRSTCGIAMIGAGACDEDWVKGNVSHFQAVSYAYEDASPFGRGRRGAYDWILGELKSVLNEAKEASNPWSIVRAWAEGESTPAGVLQTAIDAITVERREGGGSEALSIIKSCFDAPDSVLVPRARYNHLLEVERNAQEFVESFTRWEA